MGAPWQERQRATTDDDKDSSTCVKVMVPINAVSQYVPHLNRMGENLTLPLFAWKSRVHGIGSSPLILDWIKIGKFFFSECGFRNDGALWIPKNRTNVHQESITTSKILSTMAEYAFHGMFEEFESKSLECYLDGAAAFSVSTPAGRSSGNRSASHIIISPAQRRVLVAAQQWVQWLNLH